MPRLRRKKVIAAIEIHGVIGRDVKESEYSAILRKVRDDKRIGGLFIDIDSPGGSASGSDSLYQSVRHVAEKKPVLAFVRGVGASGGYYVACGAHRIFAARAALVGSIGVIALRPVLAQMLEKIGVELTVIKAGHLKDMHGFWRRPTDEEAGKWQSLIDESYELFVSVVVERRRMPDDDVRRVATGELFSAATAVHNKLVDRSGDFYAARDALIEEMRTRGVVVKNKWRWLSPKRSMFQRLGFAGGARSWRQVERLAEALTEGGLYYLSHEAMGCGRWP